MPSSCCVRVNIYALVNNLCSRTRLRLSEVTMRETACWHTIRHPELRFSGVECRAPHILGQLFNLYIYIRSSQHGRRTWVVNWRALSHRSTNSILSRRNHHSKRRRSFLRGTEAPPTIPLRAPRTPLFTRFALNTSDSYAIPGVGIARHAPSPPRASQQRPVKNPLANTYSRLCIKHKPEVHKVK